MIYLGLLSLLLPFSIVAMFGCAANDSSKFRYDAQNVCGNISQLRCDANGQEWDFFLAKEKQQPTMKTMVSYTDEYQLLLTLNYQKNQYHLDEDAQERIRNILKGNHFKSIRIEGYTDNSGAASYNEKLAKLRAVYVRDFIISFDVPEKVISTDSFGKCCYLNENLSTLDQERNRRVEIYFS